MCKSVWTRMRRAAASGDVGASLISVLGVAVVLSLLIMTATLMVARQTIKSRQVQDWSASRSAALSGADDFAARVADRGQDYINTFSTDQTNPAVDTNPATPECDGSGQLIRTSGGTETRFCYRLISNDVATGKVLLEVTGIAGVGDKKEESKITVEYGVGGGESFAKYSWFTDYNTNDPIVANYSADKAAICTDVYRWNGRPKGECSRSTTLGQTLDGPYHSNDWWEFYDDVTFTSPNVTNAGPPPFYEPFPNRTAQLLGTTVKRVPIIKLPQTTVALQKYVLPKHDTDPNTDRPGCLYEGQTKFVFNGTNFTVDSPNTTSVGAHCPAHGASGSIPPLLYVKRASNSATCATNRATSFYNPSEVTGTWTAQINYDGCNGTAAVEGNVNGASVTVYAEDEAVITDNLTVSNLSSSDKIGVVAKGFVWIHNPWSQITPPVFIKPSGDRIVHASLVSLNHTILAQNIWKGGRRGALKTHGSMIMKYQALFASFGGGGSILGGYEVQHTYDERLQDAPPPYFVKPTTGKFGIVSMSYMGNS